MKLQILGRKELDDMFLFSKYINKIACPTEFAIATGLLDYRNSDDVVCSQYFVNNSLEMFFTQTLAIGIEGQYKLISKTDKYFFGVRIAVSYSDIKNEVIDELKVNEDISILEYGYFPKKVSDIKMPRIPTGFYIKLPKSNREFDPTVYEKFNVYKYGDKYFVSYPINRFTKIGNEHFEKDEKALFLIEPIRFWRDHDTDLCISQDIIMGGVAYTFLPDEKECDYDDYDESSLKVAVNYIEENIDTLSKLIGRDKKKVKK